MSSEFGDKGYKIQFGVMSSEFGKRDIKYSPEFQVLKL
jgi:hypothetical protein